jgi:hypothetical protein
MLHEGLALGHAMADVAAKHAGAEWTEMALNVIKDYARTHQKFTTEQVRAANDDLPPPPDKRAWGAVVRMAHKEGVIEPNGWVRAESRTVHGMVVTMWSSKIYRGALS